MVWSEPLHCRCSTSIKTMDREAGVRLCSQFHSAKQVQDCREWAQRKFHSTHTHACSHTHGTATSCQVHCGSTAWVLVPPRKTHCICRGCVWERERVPQSRALLQWQKFNPCGFLGSSLNKEASRSVVNQVFTRLEPLSNKNLCPRRTTEEESLWHQLCLPAARRFWEGEEGLQ